MGPDDVGQVGGEVRIVRRGQPLGQHLAAILAGNVGLGSAEELRLHHPAADGVCHLAAAAVEDDHLARIVGPLAADLREEGGEAVVVVHRPAVERMVVALGALDAHAHEHLGDVLRDLQRVGLVLVVVGGRILEGAALGRRAAPAPIWSTGTLLAILSCSQL